MNFSFAEYKIRVRKKRYITYLHIQELEFAKFG